MGDREETEFKLSLRGEAQFQRLAEHLAGPGSWPLPTVRQHNRFFDTPEGALERAGLVLRVREEAGRSVVTAKGPATFVGDRAVTRKSEEECVLPPALHHSLREGTRSPLDLLIDTLARPLPPLLSRMQELVGEARLCEVGAFQNDRSRLGPLPIRGPGQVMELVLEFDRTHFPGGRIDYEVEIEVAEQEITRARGLLRGLFAQLELPWESAPSKLQRFREARAALGRTEEARPGSHNVPPWRQ